MASSREIEVLGPGTWRGVMSRQGADSQSAKLSD